MPPPLTGCARTDSGCAHATINSTERRRHNRRIDCVAEQDKNYDVETAFGTTKLSIDSFTAGTPDIGIDITICIRPEQFRPVSDNTNRVALCQAEVVDGAFFGTHFRCHLRSQAALELILVAHMPQSTQLKEGDTIDVSINPADIVAVPSNGLAI